MLLLLLLLLFVWVCGGTGKGAYELSLKESFHSLDKYMLEGEK